MVNNLLTRSYVIGGWHWGVVPLGWKVYVAKMKVASKLGYTVIPSFRGLINQPGQHDFYVSFGFVAKGVWSMFVRDT